MCKIPPTLPTLMWKVCKPWGLGLLVKSCKSWRASNTLRVIVFESSEFTGQSRRTEDQSVNKITNVDSAWSTMTFGNSIRSPFFLQLEGRTDTQNYLTTDGTQGSTTTVLQLLFSTRNLNSIGNLGKLAMNKTRYWFDGRWWGAEADGFCHPYAWRKCHKLCIDKLSDIMKKNVSLFCRFAPWNLCTQPSKDPRVEMLEYDSPFWYVWSSLPNHHRRTRRSFG